MNSAYETTKQIIQYLQPVLEPITRYNPSDPDKYFLHFFTGLTISVILSIMGENVTKPKLWRFNTAWVTVLILAVTKEWLDHIGLNVSMSSTSVFSMYDIVSSLMGAFSGCFAVMQLINLGLYMGILKKNRNGYYQ